MNINRVEIFLTPKGQHHNKDAFLLLLTVFLHFILKFVYFAQFDELFLFVSESHTIQF